MKYRTGPLESHSSPSGIASLYARYPASADSSTSPAASESGKSASTIPYCPNASV